MSNSPSPHISRPEIVTLPQDIITLMQGPCLPHELEQGQVREKVRRVFRREEQVFASPDICARILDEVNKSEPLTWGQEGKIYKIRLGDKHIIVVKKRGFDNDNEYNLHREAVRALSRSGISPTTLVSIPKLYGKFEVQKPENGSIENSYIIMEYIPGKTIYNLMCASIIHYWKEKAKHIPAIANALSTISVPGPEHVELEHIPRGLSIVARHEKEIGISIDNDTQAEDIIKAMYAELVNAGIVSSDRVGKHHRLFHDIKSAPVFTDSEFSLLKSELSEFLRRMHAQGVHHRDVGDNPRNLMLGEDGRIYLIDFGRSKIIVPESEEDVYGNEIENARFTPDIHLIPYLANLTKRQDDLSNGSFHNRVQKLKSKTNITLLSHIAQAYGISDELIRKEFEQYPTGSGVGAISNLFDRTKVSDLHMNGIRKLDGKKVYKNTQATRRYVISLLIQISMLDQDELIQLQKVIQEKSIKPELKDVYLEYVAQFMITSR